MAADKVDRMFGLTALEQIAQAIAVGKIGVALANPLVAGQASEPTRVIGIAVNGDFEHRIYVLVIRC